MTATPPKKLPQPVMNEPEDVESQIRLRAYELYEARGREDGRDMADWLQAEEELTKREARPIAA